MSHPRAIFSFAIACLIVGSLIPYWTVHYVGPSEITSERGNLYEEFKRLPNNARQIGFAGAMQLAISDNVFAALLHIILGAAVGDAWFTHRNHRRHVAGLCANCGYDLRASTIRCPECGTPIASKPQLPGN